MNWSSSSKGFDEVFLSEGKPRKHYEALLKSFGKMSSAEIERREHLQYISLLNQGITFNVYGEKEGRERVFPFDFVPRIVTAAEWEHLKRGLVQRITAINMFLLDIYGDQRVMHEGVVPWELILSRKEYRRELRGLIPPRNVFTHVVGTDLVRDDQGEYRVLEDNCRCPSGVSYVVENRNLLQRTFPEVFAKYPVRPVRDYPQMLLDTLSFVAPRWGEQSLAVVLTPGSYNSAYFEHSFLAREMGIPLVEGRDLIVEDNQVYARTTEGRRRVEVIYRRIDDDFLDPVVFERSSTLGVPGLVNAYREGNVAIANAPGAGVADDKAVYAFIPDIIRHYLSEEPILKQVQTFTGYKPEDFAYMTANAKDLVIKTTGDAGGYGMLMGPFSTAKEIREYVSKMHENPGNYVAQPLVEISSHPTYSNGEFAPRRVDLRPFVLYGDRVKVLPGGLTRVALTPGSYVVNSSQGGGSKDTWVLEDKRMEGGAV
jgi:uncharacterized circularly permuted ATP-grasp superfamily protein